MSIRVLIADPEPFFSDALASALDGSDAVRVVGTTRDEREAERLCGTASPDVVVSEVSLAPGSGLALARRLGDAARVLILTREHPGDVLLDAVEAGAAGCVGHEVGVAALVSLIEHASSGGFAVDTDRLADALRRIASARAERVAGPADLSLLTGREREVLRLLAKGLDNDAIGKQLYLSAHTVRTHVGKVLRKLGAHSRAEAARLALSFGESTSGVHVSRIGGPEFKRTR